jgi:hypothetical protein
MTRYEVVSEAIIEAAPPEVAFALQELGAGRAGWWEPYLRMRPIGHAQEGVGAAMEVAINDRGALSRWDTARFISVVRELEQDRRLVVQFIDGDLRGSAEWTFEPVGDGRTEVRMVWRADPHGLLVRILSHLRDFEAAQQRVMQHGFQQLQAYLRAQRLGGTPA